MSLVASQRSGRWEPPTDILVSEGEVVVRLELAGLRPEEIDLTVEGRVLRVSGVRARECPEGPCEYRQVEISYGPFERVIEFPFPIGNAPVEATCAEGFLTIRVRLDPQGARRVAIQSLE